MRHQAFEAEIQANKPRLKQLCEEGNKLMEEKPDSAEVVSHSRVPTAELSNMWPQQYLLDCNN